MRREDGTREMPPVLVVEHDAEIGRAIVDQRQRRPLPARRPAGDGTARGGADEARRVRECHRSVPRRTRYVLTVRLGLGVERHTLRQAAEPMALHLSRIQQLQLYALDALLHAASAGRKAKRPGLRADIIAALWLMAVEGL